MSEWNKRTPGVLVLEGMGQKGEMLWSDSEKFETQMSDNDDILDLTMAEVAQGQSLERRRPRNCKVKLL